MKQVKNFRNYTKIYFLCVVVNLVIQNCGADMSKTFFYFAYGSNLLTQRIHINSPSAVRKGCGKLKDYRLDFNLFSNRWKGSSATIVPTKNSTVWGAVWEIDSSTIPDLDKQEGVDQNIYFPFEANIELLDGTQIKCRVYQQCQTPPELKEGESLQKERLPSAVYLNTIKKGAAESDLPIEYQNFLNTFQDNGYNGEVHVKLDLDK